MTIKKRTYTTKEITVMFLRKHLKDLNKPSYLLRNSTLQTKLPEWAKEIFGVMHSPETYSRAWRELRENDCRELRNYNVLVEELAENPTVSAEKMFRVRAIAPLAKPKAEPTQEEIWNLDPDLKLIQEVFPSARRIA